jgi:hypothetical protein
VIGLSLGCKSPNRPSTPESVDSGASAAVGDNDEAHMTGAGGATVQAVATTGQVPAWVNAPFYGEFYGTTSSPGATPSWYDVPGSPQHRSFATFDDTNAYDLNLHHGIDQNLPAIAPAACTVTSLGTTFPGTLSGGSLGSVLLDCGGWYMGLMHLKNIQVKSGDRVSQGQLLGTIWDTGAPGVHHLHAAFYQKQTVSGVSKLVSRRVNFVTRAVPLLLPSSVAVNIGGGSTQISGRVSYFGGAYRVEDNYYFNSTWWTSSNSGVASVDGRGRVTGRARGSATIQLSFSGRMFSIPVTVR